MRLGASLLGAVRARILDKRYLYWQGLSGTTIPPEGWNDRSRPSRVVGSGDGTARFAKRPIRCILAGVANGPDDAAASHGNHLMSGEGFYVHI